MIQPCRAAFNVGSTQRIQCIAYAEQYDAVLFLVVYMARPEHPIPTHWIDRSAPLRVGHKQPGVPIYFAARPRHWSEPWSSQFKR